MKTDCEGERIFTVSVNGHRIEDIDLWSESGFAGACKKTVTTQVKEGGILMVEFPEVKAGQAVISAIAIATENDMPTSKDIAFRPLTTLSEDYWASLDRDTLAIMPKELLPEQRLLEPTAKLWLKSTDYYI